MFCEKIIKFSQTMKAQALLKQTCKLWPHFWQDFSKDILGRWSHRFLLILSVLEKKKKVKK